MSDAEKLYEIIQERLDNQPPPRSGAQRVIRVLSEENVELRARIRELEAQVTVIDADEYAEARSDPAVRDLFLRSAHYAGLLEDQPDEAA